MKSKVLIWAREADFFRARLSARMPDFTFVSATARADALKAGADCDVLMARNDESFEGVAEAMPRLRWIQALTTGTERIEAIPRLPQQVIITAARGFHGPQMSELAFLSMLSLSRNFRQVLANQRERRWERWPQKLLIGKTVVILGIGAIGEEVAQRCRAFGMKVIGIDAVRKAAPGVDAIHPPARLTEIVAAADFLIVLVPYTKDTHHLVNAAVLEAMKPSGVLINLCRGQVVDEAALIRTLSAGRIGGAALDVFETEPLPADSPLWDLPNVIVTPHIGGMSDIYAEQVLPVLIDNLLAYAAGTPTRMRYVVRM